jgi:hypothetical protein
MKTWESWRVGKEEGGRKGELEKSLFVFFLLPAFLWIPVLSFDAFAQRANGTIGGRVIADDGQPIPNAVVNLSGMDTGRKRATGSRLDIFTSSDSESDKPPRPAAWEAGERAKLRKEAETGNMVIELERCQRVAGYVLRLTK